MTSEAGFLVKSECGRKWFVPLQAVGRDYADYLRQVDCLTDKEAQAASEAKKDFWPQWFAEQCNLWGDVERLGRLVKDSSLRKTKAALDRLRGSNNEAFDDYERVGF